MMNAARKVRNTSHIIVSYVSVLGMIMNWLQNTFSNERSWGADDNSRDKNIIYNKNLTWNAAYTADCAPSMAMHNKAQSAWRKPTNQMVFVTDTACHLYLVYIVPPSQVYKPMACLSGFPHFTIVPCLCQWPTTFHWIGMLQLFSVQSRHPTTQIASGTWATIWFDHCLILDVY